ncbi:uncharacterized protein LOC135438930 [Drosophila montana]|uniref:uncharacterized protein LOC135438930 n=1 Tax=Drosophila montana TaxID=40370 RepID=UPI00313CC957
MDIQPLSKDLFEEFNCKLTKSRYFNCNMIVRRNIEQLDVEATLDMLKSNNQSIRFFQEYLDVCQFFSTPHKNRLFGLVAKRLTNSLNGSLKCPVVANFNYTLNNYYLAETDFPNYVPESQFRTMMKFYTYKKLILRLGFSGRVQYKKLTTD